MVGNGDSRGFFRAFQTQVPLVIALDQVADRGGRKQISERSMRRPGIKWINLVGQQPQARVGTQVCGDLLSPGFVDVQLVREQGRVVLLEPVLDVLPSEALSRWRN